MTGTNKLIPAEEFRHSQTDETGEVQKDANGHELKGRAIDRALAYLAHGESPHAICPLFGSLFGTIYDISTVFILWFAGASAMAGLLNMVPRYLPRYGMAPQWAAAYRPLVVTFTIINLIVTWCFRANVAAQGGAYATGVLVLMTSACIGSWVHIYRKKPLTTQDLRGRLRMLIGFGLITVVFINTTIANMIARPNGVVIASIFILCVMIISIMSRVLRSVAIPDRWVRLHRSCERPTADTLRTKALAAIDSKLAEPIVQGQRVFTCGHSFYVWVPGIVVDHIRELCSSDNNALGREATAEAINKNEGMPDTQFCDTRYHRTSQSELPARTGWIFDGHSVQCEGDRLPCRLIA